MKVKDVNILIIAPEASKDIMEQPWYVRWGDRLAQAVFISASLDDEKQLANWQERISSQLQKCDKPIIIIAQSIGIAAFLSAARDSKVPIAGAFFVAPVDCQVGTELAQKAKDFLPYPEGRLPYPSVVIGSQNDTHCSLEEAKKLANTFHSLFLDGGEAGHINEHSGYGPWPEGFMVFSKMLSQL